MFKNLLKTAIRNFRKEKFYTIINISGLTIGLTSALLLLFYVQHELSYDSYHENAEDIYRVVSYIQEPDNEFTWAVAQIPLTRELKENYTDIKNAGRFFDIGRNLFIVGENRFYEEAGEVFLADSSVLKMFSYEFIHGDVNTALSKPNSLVITESLARKYFGQVDVVGKQVTDQDDMTFEITGVIQDIPDNSHLRFSALLSRNTIPEWQGSWGGFGVYTYIQLEPNQDIGSIEEHLSAIIKEKVDPIFEPIGIRINYQLQKITDIHLKSKIADEAESAGDMSYIYIFSIVAVFMIIIACINYMNLATARASKRAKEVGIRKVVGSDRKMLILQFLSESVIMALISAVVAILLIWLLIPGFNDISGKAFSFSTFFNFEILVGVVILMILVGVLSGLYPAYYLSAFKPTEVIKGRGAGRKGNQMLRKALVVFQFAISVFMLISTLVVYDQLEYVRNKDLGFSHDHVVRLELGERPMMQQYSALRNGLLQLPGIINVASSSASPGIGVGKNILNVEDNNGQMVERGVDMYRADYDFVDVLEMKIVQGRNFSRDILSDTSSALLVNEAMVERMAWEDPLGKKFQLGGPDGPLMYQVVGVVKDYHQNSLYDVIEPIMFFMGEDLSNVFIKVQGTDLDEVLASIEKVWNQTFPDKPFEYVFLDEVFDEQYTADQKRGTLFTIFSSLTIFIACLGLLGLASYSTEQRTKEIGVRKVVGASITQIMVLVCKEFLWLVIIASILAIPLAYTFMGGWLESFAYRITMNQEIPTVIISVIIALTITFLTVGFHSLKAAVANPVNALGEQ